MKSDDLHDELMKSKTKRTPNNWLKEGQKLGWAYRINPWRYPYDERETMMATKKMTYKEFHDTIAY